jgi:hypothetical protein
MRKVMTIFTVTFAIILWCKGTVLAGDYTITYWQLMKRSYEDGRVFNRLGFAVVDGSDNFVIYNVIKTVTSVGPSGPISLPEKPPEQGGGTDANFSDDSILYGSYDGDTEEWSYDSDFHYENYFGINFSGDLEIGNDTLSVIDVDDVTMPFAAGDGDVKYFNGIVNLPKISAKSFRGYEDTSGNLLCQWSLPMDTYFYASSPNCSFRCFILIYNGNSFVGEIFVKVPVAVSMMFVPNSVMDKAKLMGDNFLLGVHLRTNDNNNRIYTKNIPLTTLKKKSTNVVVVPLM